MSVSKHFLHYLDKHDVNYETVQHAHSASSLQSSSSAHVASRQVVKAIVLEARHNPHYFMAVIPACNRLHLSWLNSTLGQDLRLVEENRLASLFIDCELGAVPPMGTLYHMRTVWDDKLKEENDLYLEAGDHETLLHVHHHDLEKLNPCGVYADISVPEGAYMIAAKDGMLDLMEHS
ncbi:MAG: YbaK/EbsC family protein [Pseudomonadales bacterium]|nr:YbaK/EbsC family protein [Pseudomonadales bacterium]